MGIPDGAHAHGHGGGSGLGPVVLALLAVALLGPAVAAAAAELLHVLVIVAGVIVGVGAVCVAGLLAWRWRRPRLDAARTAPPSFAEAKAVRAAPPLPKVQRQPGLPSHAQRELPGGVHLHFHGVNAEDVAEILRAQDRPARNDWAR
jgi:hypothetical protein